jgi:dienelactone hydrolase
MKTLLLLAASCAVLSGQEDPTEPKLQPPVKQGMKYYVSLPKGWNPSKKWPVVVTIDGSGQTWEANAKNFAKARKDMPFVIVTPVMLRLGPPEKRQYPQELVERVRAVDGKVIEFNDEGLLAVIRDARKKFSTQKKFYLTGFSAGGHTCWEVIFTWPEKLAAVGIAAGNYDGRWIDKISKSPARAQLPIKEFLGTKDAFLKYLLPQWNKAKEEALANGFKNLDLEMVEGRPHNAFAPEVLAYFNGLRK